MDNELKIEGKKKKAEVEDIIINTTFIMADAIDILIREAEYRMEKKHTQLTQKYKQMHSNLMKRVADVRIALEKYNQMSDSGLSWRDRDSQREDANYICRIMMLIADRTAYDESVEKEIEDFIKSIKGKGFVDDDTINLFHLK